MFLVDVSVPRSFDPRIDELENVYLYDIDDLSLVAESNRDSRGREADRAEHIVDEEVDGFERWLTGLEATPTIVAHRDKAETIRRAELAKTRAALPELPPTADRALEALTSAIVNKLLHGPITHLKHPDRRETASIVAAARRLFDIDRAEDS
jgi:glutamyl-tRNA reductase